MFNITNHQARPLPAIVASIPHSVLVCIWVVVQGSPYGLKCPPTQCKRCSKCGAARPPKGKATRGNQTLRLTTQRQHQLAPRPPLASPAAATTSRRFATGSSAFRSQPPMAARARARAGSDAESTAASSTARGREGGGTAVKRQESGGNTRQAVGRRAEYLQAAQHGMLTASRSAGLGTHPDVLDAPARCAAGGDQPTDLILWRERQGCGRAR